VTPAPAASGKPAASPLVDRAWALPIADVLQRLNVDAARGLSQSEVRQRRRRHGPNRVLTKPPRSALRILLDQFTSLMMALLLAAVALAFAMVDWVDGVAILAVVVLNAAIGFVTELHAVRSMEALRKLAHVNARVRRDGAVQEIAAEDIVPGDIVIVESGDIVAADLRLIEASTLQVDESALTGEAMPVGKSVEPVDASVPLAERASILFKATAVTRGSGEAVAVATADATELGRIAALVSETLAVPTPLERRLEALGRRLIWITLALATGIATIGIIAGRELALMVEVAIALAIATVPEGLPVVATIALARGMWRMARRQALINRLSAVETLGATTVIFTDKTGTLTEGRMTVTRLVLAEGPIDVQPQAPHFVRSGNALATDSGSALHEMLQTGVLCNNADLPPPDALPDQRPTGDPLEAALLLAGRHAGLERNALREAAPEVREIAFDDTTKMMATVNRFNGVLRFAVKGAPEAVLDACSQVRGTSHAQPLTAADRAHWLECNEALAREGLRVLALAQKQAARPDEPPYEQLELLGLIGLSDPPRADVRDSIARCCTAGIRVLMVTGDQPATARAVAHAVGLVDNGDETDIMHGRDLKPPAEIGAGELKRLRRATIFARVSPKQKFDLIAIYQEAGDVVAMTGDGVNDAPALKKADIGVAMGRRGTQVAREAAAMVLKDDAFSSIVAAVEQGRIIFNNIRKFVLYLLSCNVGELMVVGVATLANSPLPILPLQILFLNLVTDVFPALALGVGPSEPDLMRRPPRAPRERIITALQWRQIAAYGALMTVAVLSAFAIALGPLALPLRVAVTIAFLTMALAQLWHVFNMRDASAIRWRNEITRNPAVWVAIAICLALLAGALYVPPLATLLQLQRPGAEGWALVLGFSMLPLVIAEIVRRVPSLRAQQRPAREPDRNAGADAPK
jgi:Ca2+-transporting ATPase